MAQKATVSVALHACEVSHCPEGNGLCRTARLRGVTPVFVTFGMFSGVLHFPGLHLSKDPPAASQATSQATRNNNVALSGLDHQTILALFAATLSKLRLLLITRPD
jgi:hypothetical protein